MQVTIEALLQVSQVVKEYTTAQGVVRILSGVDLTLERGHSAAIMGPSGSGKSTLLYVLGALEPPTSGRITLDGVDPFSLSARDLAAFRNRSVGFLFQDHCLLPQCTVLENVLTPTLVPGFRPEHEARARKLLDEVGLASRLHHRPAELSGGEKQRAALARALILEPTLLLCDEPTGNLDSENARAVADLLFEQQRQTMMVVVTHSPELASRLPVRYKLKDHHLCRS